jgi:mono/diheme cytochrome c family protein
VNWRKRGLKWSASCLLAGAVAAMGLPDVLGETDMVDLGAGKSLYDSACAACHGAQGEGADRAPPMAGNPFLADVGFVLELILSGAGDMPPFGGLSDREVSAVATFIRNSFGNDFGIIAEEEVATARQ